MTLKVCFRRMCQDTSLRVKYMPVERKKRCCVSDRSTHSVIVDITSRLFSTQNTQFVIYIISTNSVIAVEQ